MQKDNKFPKFLLSQLIIYQKKGYRCALHAKDPWLNPRLYSKMDSQLENIER